MVSKTAEY